MHPQEMLLDAIIEGLREEQHDEGKTLRRFRPIDCLGYRCVWQGECSCLQDMCGA